MKKDVLNFMYYLLNKWCEDECNMLFGESLGEHIYKKYVYCLQKRLRAFIVVLGSR